MGSIGIKRQLITLRRIMVAGFHNLFRNAWLTTAAIAVMVVTLTVILTGVISYKALNDTVDDVSKKLTVSVYLADTISAERQAKLEESLKQSTEVASITFKSKEEARRDLQDRYQENPTLLSGLGLAEDNPLPASLEVALVDLDDYQAVIDAASAEEYKDDVFRVEFSNIKRESFNNFITSQQWFARVSIAAAAIFGTISVLIIFNTIRMAIFTRSDEIEIMKLIGATPRYIKGPFIFEAALYGFIAAIISLGVTYSALLSLSPKLNSEIIFDETLRLFTEYWYIVFAATIGIGVMIGYFSSIFAIAKYLRIKRW